MTAWQGDRLVVRAPDAVGRHGSIELNGIPLVGVCSLSLLMSATDMTRATIEIEVTPDIEVGAIVEYQTEDAS